MDLSKTKEKQARAYAELHGGGLSAQFAYMAGWAAAEELYRPLLEAVEKIATDQNYEAEKPWLIARDALSKNIGG